MASVVRLFIDKDGRSLVQAKTNSASFTLPDWIQGDTLPLEVMHLLRSSSYPVGSAPFSVLSTNDYTLKVGLYLLSGGTQLSFQNTFTADTNATKYSGNLALNTAAITTAMGSGTSITCVLEIEITNTDGSVETTYQNRAVTVRKEYISTSTIPVPEGEVAATQSWVAGTTIPKAPANGFRLILPDSTGTYATEIFTDTDGTFKTNSITL